MSKRAREKLRRRLEDVRDVARDVRDILAEALGFLVDVDGDPVTVLVAQAHWHLEILGLGDGDPDRAVGNAPPVCPGCFAVGPEKHAGDCIDQEMEMERLDREERERNDPTEEDDDAAEVLDA